MVIAAYDPAQTTGATASAVSKARAAGLSLGLVDLVARRTRVEHNARRWLDHLGLTPQVAAP